ncbi:PP2C family protein-serine/threonine phosphatase [Microbacterium schleiferi]|uniref:PP2C family protein-serine/threonine phosphatase n=1 Tax=Microbacterium schleiferi TaxID=69362 RepID=UPI00311F027C
MYDEQASQRALDALAIVDTPADERVDRIVRLAAELFRVPMVGVTLLDRERQWRKSQIGLGPEAARQDSFCDVTARRDRTVVVEDATVDPDFANNPFVVGDPNLRFYAGHPLHAPGGEPVGTLCILDTEARSLTADERGLLEELAGWVQAEISRELEIDQAALVQRALLPREVPEVDGYRIAASAVGPAQLMGDFYDVRALSEHLRVVLADVMGKGIGPAIIAASVRASLRTSPERSILRAMDDVDTLLVEDLAGSSSFVTSFYVDVDLKSGDFSYVDAGHGLGYILRRDDTWSRLRTTGLPLGLGLGDVGDLRAEANDRLEPGDILMCCSDGLLDVLDEDAPLDHVRRVVRDRGIEGAAQEASRLGRTRRAIDDVTVVLVERLG